MGIGKKIVDALEGPAHTETGPDADADAEVRGEVAGVSADEANRLADRHSGKEDGTEGSGAVMPGSSGGTNPDGPV